MKATSKTEYVILEFNGESPPPCDMKEKTLWVCCVASGVYILDGLYAIEDGRLVLKGDGTGFESEQRRTV